MHFALPKIYPITDCRLSKLTHAEQTEKLIAGGATFVQLREKYAAPKDFYEQAKLALEIARRNNVKIIINDRVDIALALKADGVHLGQDDLSPVEARKILGKNVIIGLSTHNLAQASEAVDLPIDYVAIGPVFATDTKENPDDEVGIENLKQIRKAIGKIPLVAIGGINSSNFREVLDTGADSVAIISDLVSDAAEIERKMAKLLSSEPTKV
jgi:thiamine-phosphate pyrophosphorylase